MVVQTKTAQADGYEAVQVGLVEERPARANKPQAGHYKKAGVPPTRVRRELKVAKGAEAPKAGDQVLVNAVFNNGDRVDVIGVSRGKGFQGVMKRHNFPAARRPTARCSTARPARSAPRRIPSRVIKGMRAAGRMGGDRVTVRNLKIVQVDAENNLLVIRGAVPGRARRLRRGAQGDRREAGAAGAGREAGKAAEVKVASRSGRSKAN